MLKKIAVLSAFFCAAILPAPSALAWDRVCMHNPLWKSGFSVNFEVVHTFKQTPGKIPNAVFMDDGSLRALPDGRMGNMMDHRWHARAKGRIQSPTFPVRNSRCVDIRKIPNGQPFFVYAQASAGQEALCETHRSNPNPWYVQQNARYRDLWYTVWGAAWSPGCKFTHEAN